ncbi:hypothetical protein Pla144_11750 [Bythopirellula polymerisocia]|uniref:Uncharacterized protein n=1 Tax=Bythopirellula polymerisocia TaxID=2528003 RepID=A0A5C6D690_9BACT|nr:hypothetical protein Pla144_11750 [Bythopirellula polymerisocia]
MMSVPIRRYVRKRLCLLRPLVEQLEIGGFLHCVLFEVYSDHPGSKWWFLASPYFLLPTASPRAVLRRATNRVCFVFRKHNNCRMNVECFR